jgi:hypothetical protein
VRPLSLNDGFGMSAVGARQARPADSESFQSLRPRDCQTLLEESAFFVRLGSQLQVYKRTSGRYLLTVRLNPAARDHLRQESIS